MLLCRKLPQIEHVCQVHLILMGMTCYWFIKSIQSLS
jgi:hypothetical protein